MRMGGQPDRRYIIATDVGGTCTDCLIMCEGFPPYIGKALSTPPNFADGVIDSIRSALPELRLTLEELLEQTQLFLHGSTIAENTILTGSGSRIGLLATAGFEDTLLVTRGAYGRWGGLTEDEIKHPIMTDRPVPLVTSERLCGVTERIDYKGAVVAELDEAEVERAVRYLVDEQKVEAIAVCLLWSVANPSHERRIRDIIKRVAPRVLVSLSSDTSTAPGEYERTSTTAINAYTEHIVKGYLLNLQRVLSECGYDGPVMVMQGYGGLLPAAEAAERSIGMIESGPAAGVIAASFVGDLMGDRDVIAADMGGTTFKVSVVQNGRMEYAREPMVGRYHYVAPKIEVFSIGVAGGSIVSLDPGTNIPMVGPRSAGALPGPVCYGLGGREPTLTDVLLLIGYLDPKTFLYGSMTLDPKAARRVFAEQIADPLGMPIEEAAFGIYQVAAAQIFDLIHKITVERGLDPRDFVLHSFGGTCGLLAGMFGQELQVKRVVIPYTASVNCALGLVAADIVHEYSITKRMIAPPPATVVNAIYDPMIEKALSQLRSEGFYDEKIRLQWSIDLRYGRQVHEVTTPVNARTPLDENGVQQIVHDFEQLYEQKYGPGSAFRGAEMEMTAFRLTARGLMSRPQIERSALTGSSSIQAKTGERAIFVPGKKGIARASIYDFLKLKPGNVIEGPAIIHTPITTIAVQDRQIARMDEFRNVILEF
jgi:N-methylhydantoinase A